MLKDIKKKKKQANTNQNKARVTMLFLDTKGFKAKSIVKDTKGQ